MNEIAAVVDTNVLIDIFSISDLVRAHSVADVSSDSAELLFRRIRARESLLLAWFFHRSKLATRSYGSEATRILSRLSPPDRRADFEVNFTRTSIWFIKDYMLPGWSLLADRGEPEHAGNAADDHLVTLARRLKAPLITNEGFTIEGVNEAHGIRGLARARGVRVFSPAQFWRGKMSEGGAVRHIFQRFDREAPKYLRSQSYGDGAKQALLDRRNILRYLLQGESAHGPVKLHWDRPA